MEIFRKYIPAERENDLKATGFDNHFFDAIAVIIQKIYYFVCRIPIHVSCEFQMETIAFSMMKDSKIWCHWSNPVSLHL